MFGKTNDEMKSFTDKYEPRDTVIYDLGWYWVIVYTFWNFTFVYIFVCWSYAPGNTSYHMDLCLFTILLP